MLRSDLCDYSEAYIFVKGTIDLLADDANEIHKAEKKIAFKNNYSLSLLLLYQINIILTICGY